MKITRKILSSAFVTLGCVFSISSILADPPPPPPPPPPASGAAPSESGVIDRTKLGQMLRHARKSGLIQYAEGVSEDEILMAMITMKAPVKKPAAQSAKTPKQAPVQTKTQAEMMAELNAKLEKRKAGGAATPTPEAASVPKGTEGMNPNPLAGFAGKLRSPQKSAQPEAKPGVSEAPANPWGVKLRNSTAG